MIQKLIGERSEVSMALAILLGSVLFWLSIDPVQVPPKHWLIENVFAFPITEKVLSMIVLIGLVLFYRDIQTRMKLSVKRGYFQPVLFSLFLIPIGHVSFIQTAALVCLTFGLMMLFATHRSDKPEPSLQRVGIACGVATMLYPPLIWGALIALLMSIRLRQRSWRKGVIFVLGLLLPFVFLFTFLLAMNWHEGKLADFFSSIIARPENSITPVAWIPGLAILAYTIFKPMGDNYSAGLIPIREMELLQTQLIWIFGFILLGIFDQIHWSVAICAAAIPLSGLTTISLENASKWWIPDLAVIVLIASFLLS